LGVLHRDLKPLNVMMNGDDDLVVTDFGIGRILDAEGDRVTATGQFLGSELHGSPEQFTDLKKVDHRSDIYSLGRMLYELCTERLNSAVQNLDRVPPNFAHIIERCTQYHPKDRYQNVTELKDEWQKAIEATSQDGGVGKIKRLVTELEATPSARPKVERLLQLLGQNLRHEDLVRDVVESIPVESAALMLSMDGGKFREFVRTFVKIVVLDGAGPSRLDKLGSRCGNLFIALLGPQVRAELVFCTLLIGTKRHRHGVLEILSQLLQSVGDPLEVRAIQDRLKDVPKERRLEAGQLLQLDELDTKIADLFRA
jgi:hypothetical protein